jgi:predicted RNase H-like HicB family nuclease
MYTAVYFEGQDGWFIGYVRELPGAFAQGRDLAELWQNLRDARDLMLRQIIKENENIFTGLKEAGRAEAE